jgi:polyhydroxyalkanoate synthesis regulator phasin
MPTVQATFSTLAWGIVKELALSTTIEIIHSMFEDTVEPEEVANLRQRVSDLEVQLSQHQNHPMPEEFNQIKQLVTGLNQIVNVMGERLDSVENRVTKLENELTLVRETLLAIQTTAIPVNNLGFKINFLYRSKGQGDFLPITQGAVLHSGDHYKILIEPMEASYVYLFQQDGSGQIVRLFPMKTFAGVTLNNENPMQAQQKYYLPAKTKSFKLDRTLGTETFYFTASRHPDLVLENFYEAIERARKNNQPNLSAALQAEFTQTLNFEPKGPFLDEIVDDVSHMQVKNFCTGCVNIMSFEHQ